MAVLTLLEYTVKPDTSGPAYVQLTVIVAVPCAVADVIAGVPNVVKADDTDELAFVLVAVTVNEYWVFPDPPVKLNVDVPVGAASPSGILIDRPVPVDVTVMFDPDWAIEVITGVATGVTVIAVGLVLLTDAPFARTVRVYVCPTVPV